MSSKWDSALRAALAALTGETIAEAWVHEMALYGPGDTGHFADPNLPFVQANVLELRTLNATTFHISCWQDDDDFALRPQIVPAEQRLSPGPDEGWFRTRPLADFPRGMVADIRTDTSPGANIQEIRITVGGRDVILRAGEVCENVDGTLTVHDHDESVLVFLDPEAHARLVFNAPVYRPSYV